MLRSALLFVLALLSWSANADAAFRFCVSDLPPLAYRGPFSYHQGVLNRLIDNLLAKAGIDAERELLPARELLRGVLDGSCDAAATIATTYLDEEELRAWPLMELTLVVIPGIFDRPPAGRLIPAGRYATSRFSSLEGDWSEHVAGFEHVNVESYQEAWELLESGQIDGLIGIRENLAWHALDSGTFEIFADFEIPVAQRKLNLYLAPDVDPEIADRIDDVLGAMDLQKLVFDVENRRTF